MLSGRILATQSPGLFRAIVALQYRDFRLLYIASLTSTMGAILSATANTWQVYELTGSATHLGLTGLARAVPALTLSLIGGVIADRVNRKKIIMAGNAVNALVAVFLGIMTWAGLINVWHIYAAIMVGGAAGSVVGPARSAIVPNLVPREHLVNAVALNFAVFSLARMVAPAIAGVLIAFVGITLTYSLNGAAQLLALIPMLFVNVGPPPERPRVSPLKSLVEGLVFVRQRSIILALLFTDAGAMLFGSFQVLLPIFADRLGLGAEGYGALLSAEAIGALAGTLLIAQMGDFRYKGLWIVGSILAFCASLVWLALSPAFLFALLACAALGVTDSMQATPRNGVVQMVTPDELRGRVSSFSNMMTLGVPSVGQGVMGAAAAALTPPVALIVGAICCALVNVGILAARPDLRARDLGAATADAVPGRVPSEFDGAKSE
jgi:MFS family permease